MIQNTFVSVDREEVIVLELWEGVRGGDGSSEGKEMGGATGRCYQDFVSRHETFFLEPLLTPPC